MPPFRISARIDNPRFRVTFDEDASVCYCNSVKSLAGILRVHGRTIGARRLHALVGPDDRRRPRTSRRESSFEGAHITRLQYARQRTRPVQRTSNVHGERPPDDEPAFLRAYFDDVRAGRGNLSPHIRAYLYYVSARSWRLREENRSHANTPVPRFTPPQDPWHGMNLVTVLHYTPTRTVPPRRSTSTHPMFLRSRGV
jgi:hypothetical protein